MYLSPLGVPLTLLQFATVPTHQVPPLLIANNFLLGNAIYRADRLNETQVQERWECRACAIASMTIYGLHSETLWLSPLVWILHAAYADLKPAISGIKPFFVALFWTIAVYFAPLWWLSLNADPFTPAAFFLHIASLSHAADIKDRSEDLRDDIYTPAVLMDEDSSRAYLAGLALAACFLHALSPISNLSYDLCFLSLVALLFLMSQKTNE